jgi:hypothetical protein
VQVPDAAFGVMNAARAGVLAEEIKEASAWLASSIRDGKT